MLPNAGGHQCLRQQWKGKDAEATAAIAQLLGVAGSSVGPHFKTSAITVEGETVTVELCTASLGGLTENDFVIASRMNSADTKALVAKARVK